MPQFFPLPVSIVSGLVELGQTNTFGRMLTIGSGTISGAVAGSALVEVEAGGELGVDNVRAIGSAHDLHVQTDFSMGDSATLSLGVLPSITAADTLTVDGELALANTTQLNLYVEAANDATLPLGTTLLLRLPPHSTTSRGRLPSCSTPSPRRRRTSTVHPAVVARGSSARP